MGTGERKRYKRGTKFVWRKKTLTILLIGKLGKRRLRGNPTIKRDERNRGGQG